MTLMYKSLLFLATAMKLKETSSLLRLATSVMRRFPRLSLRIYGGGPIHIGGIHRRRVLILHSLNRYSRETNKEFVRAFGEFMQHSEVVYVNVLAPSMDFPVGEDFDLGVVTYEALSLRTTAAWADVEKRIVRFLASCREGVLMPQDDYTFSSRIDELAIKANVSRILTPISKDLELIFPKALRLGIRVDTILTAYVNQKNMAALKKFCKPHLERDIDLGVRVTKLPPTFGHLGSRKAEIAGLFQRLAKDRGFTTDVSFEPQNVLLGRKWHEFLGNTKFTIGRKGGASICDPKLRMSRSFGKTGVLDKSLFSESKPSWLSKKWGVRFGDFSSVSPRIFECAALRVCQILEADDYSMIGMEPWKHYIPLKKELDNLEQVFDFMGDSAAVAQMTDDAYEHLIGSGSYSYAKFLDDSFPINPRSRYGAVESVVVDYSSFFSAPRCTCGLSDKGDLRSPASKFFAFKRSASQYVPNSVCLDCKVALANWEASFKKPRGIILESFTHPWTGI